MNDSNSFAICVERRFTIYFDFQEVESNSFENQCLGVVKKCVTIIAKQFLSLILRPVLCSFVHRSDLEAILDVPGAVVAILKQHCEHC